MNRYMVLEGLSGVLVTDPHTDLPDRYVGQIRKPLEERKAATCRADRYTTCTVAVPFHHHLLKAVKRGPSQNHKLLSRKLQKKRAISNGTHWNRS